MQGGTVTWSVSWSHSSYIVAMESSDESVESPKDIELESDSLLSDGSISSTEIDDAVAVEATVDQFVGGPGGGGSGSGGTQPRNPSLVHP